MGITHILWAIIVGFVVGLIARAILPGAQHRAQRPPGRQHQKNGDDGLDDPLILEDIHPTTPARRQATMRPAWRTVAARLVPKR